MAEPVPVDDLAVALGLGRHELVALIGGGGKTTALFALGRQLGPTVVLTTTTKMGRERTGGHEPLFSPSREQVGRALAEQGTVLAWKEDAAHKAVGVEPEVCDRWFDQADHVVVEADGSRRMPFKAPLDHEPVLPSRTTILVACVGAAALGQPISEQCQRPDRVAAVGGCSPADPLTPERLARVLLSDDGSRKDSPAGARFAVMVNRVGPEHLSFVDDLAAVVGDRALVVAVAPFLPGESPERV
ncbi:MAG: putative selenium-dependent hydroxylase accessory protein YqeC [Actinomycetia bacterium]|nr:putative selenium-dependent hydroxylase accessory protein YqeC [Actinomycetes bacterium]